MYDAALLDVFGRSDGKGDRLQRPELMCFEEAHTHEEVYAQRLRALLYQQGGERRMLQEMVRCYVISTGSRQCDQCIPCKAFTDCLFCFSAL